MSRLIKIALVGRPNVGKSALFNAICKKKIAIVDETEGVTRDRLYSKAEAFGKHFEIIDTGGIDLRGKIPFAEEVRRQAEIAIEEADSLIMVVDGTLHPLDIDCEIVKLLHASKKPLCLAVNKIDSREKAWEVVNFATLGIEKMVAVSAVHGFQIAELLEEALYSFPEALEEEETAPSIKVAIVGRVNVGKSTLLNALIGQERSIVSPQAGTTRDSIDSDFLIDDTHFTFIDTAGIRRKQKEREVVEKFAHIRTERAIERADICLLVLDVMQGITSEEKRIAQAIEEAKKGCIILCNKWDEAHGIRMEHALKALELEIPAFKHYPRLCISAKAKRNIDKIYPEIKKVMEGLRKRIPTGELNRFLIAAMQHYHPPVIGGKRLRIYYIAQVGIEPPHFVLFVNNPALMDSSYKKYLVNCLRDLFGFSGVPITFQLKAKEPMRERRTRKEGARKEGMNSDRDLHHIESQVEEK